MQSIPPPLLPVLRSKTQADLLNELLVGESDELSLSALAREMGVAPSTVMREVDRLEAVGIVETRRIGRARLVRVDETSPYVEPLRELMLLAFGPARVIADEFEGIAGVSEVLLFGSWAARYEGHPGSHPHDVDVLVIGDPDRDVAYAASARAEEQLRQPVQVTFRTVAEWNDADDSFIATVRSRPLVKAWAHQS